MTATANRTLLAVRLPKPLVRTLKLEAVKRETTVQALVEEAVRGLLARRKGR